MKTPDRRGPVAVDLPRRLPAAALIALLAAGAAASGFASGSAPAGSAPAGSAPAGSALAGSPPPTPAPAAARAALPELAPLPAALASRVSALTREAERLRGLKFQRQVKSGALGTAEVRRWLEQTVAGELPPARLAELSAGLQAFGFAPPELDLARFLPDLLSEQIGGFYDTEREVLVLVRGAAARATGEGGDGRAAKEAAQIAQQAEESVLVHELTHALQDQVFALPEPAPDFFSDRAAARDALVEGDATLVMFDFMLGEPVERNRFARGLLADPMAMNAMLAGMPGADALSAAPAYFRETLLFGYFQGLAFCAEARRTGGHKLLDRAFRDDPPRSTEQILHPEKWHRRRDDPVELAWPDLGAELPGWTRLAEGELGELATGILLRSAPGAQMRPANAAAAGWGGDRFAVYGKDGERLLLWLTEWDAPAEADEFAATAARLGAGWSLERQSPTRVAVLRGNPPAETRTALLARLAAVRAERPASAARPKPE